MDKEPEELQFLSLVGIYRTSLNLVLSFRRLFVQITASLILPLSLLFLCHVTLSHLLFSQINKDESALESSPDSSPRHSRLVSTLYSEWLLFLLFKSVYLLFLLIFSLLSTSAVVFSIASIFSAKSDLTFSKILSVVPKVWRRLMFTFLYAFLILFLYNLLSVSFLVILAVLIGDSTLGIFFISFALIAYLVGLVWISVVWHLASVVSVLEDHCGIDAIKKSRSLIKGKTGIAVMVFVKLNFVFAVVELGFKELVVKGNGGFGGRVGFGLLMLFVLCLVVLFGLVVQTVVYFVCKSYHHESIDKSSLSDHLEVYLGDYVPLKEKDVQLEQYYTEEP